MRPVLLEIDGFTSYRSRTVVDFADIDFFALVGPTGSGKSTILDAITFALYGSAPRWGRENAVAPALSPTANRALVRLVFDADGQRYSVIRDVRRGGGKTQAITVKEQRLERFVRPGDDGTGDTEVLESGNAVTTRVGALLGLNFAEFCTCVVLPQGDFARFLHAKPGERQDILSKLLGHQIYDKIQSAAHARSVAEQIRADTLNQQLTQFDAIDESTIAGLEDRVAALDALAERVNTELLPTIDRAIERAEQLGGRIATTTSESALLAAVSVPQGVAVLHTAFAAAESASSAAQAANAAASARDRAARLALGAAPPRHRLEKFRDSWLDLAAVRAAMPDLERAAADAAASSTVAEAAQRRATEVSVAAQAAVLAAQRAADDAAAAASVTETHVTQCESIRVPPDVIGLAEAVRVATATDETARAELLNAETAERTARAAVAAAPARHRLETLAKQWAESAALAASMPETVRAADNSRREAAESEGAEADAVLAASAARLASSDARSALQEAEAAAARLDARLKAVAAVHVPAEVAALAAHMRDASTEFDTARTEFTACEVAAGRTVADLAALPDAGTIRSAVELARRVGVAERVAAEAIAVGVAEQAALAVLRTDRERCEKAHRATEHRVREAELGNHVSAVRATLVAGAPCPVCEQSVHEIPVATTDIEIGEAREALREYAAAYAAADRALADAERDAAIRDAASRDARARLDADRTELATACARLGVEPAEGALTELDQTREQLNEAVRAARVALEEARNTLERKQDARAAAAERVGDSRAELLAMHASVVAEGAPPVDGDLDASWITLAQWANTRSVALRTESAAVDAAATAAAATRAARDAELTAAEARVASCAAASRAAALAEQSAVRDLTEAVGRRDVLRDALAGAPEPAAVAAELEALGVLESAAEHATRTVDAAKEAARAAGERRTAASEQADASWELLRRTRDPLTAFGVPDFGSRTGDLHAVWSELVAWAAARADVLRPALAEQQRIAAESATAAQARSAARDLAEENAVLAVTAARNAALAKQSADRDVAEARHRRESLVATLDGAPDPSAVESELQLLDTLEQASRVTAGELAAAAAAAQVARDDVDALSGQVRAGWTQLRRTRDPLTVLGAPQLEPDSSDLKGAWTTLVEWATVERSARATQLAALESDAATARTVAGETERALHALLREAGIEAAIDDVSTTLVRESTAAAAKLADGVRVLERTRKIRAQAADAAEQSLVAKELALMMRSNNFPQWLIGSALAMLVADASTILAELSGGQFDLRADDAGGLHVVDHNNADLTRPVRTLSGGETFQASLALALALSRQVTALSTGGAAKLEAIFLDEGFGTLDADTLDVVATTLESLASTGSRMVGVVTHVAALADRIPVRLRVSREDSGSRVTVEKS